MANFTFNVRPYADADPVTFSYDMPENLTDAIAKYGEEAVFDNFRASVVIDLQRIARDGFKQHLGKGDKPKLDHNGVQALIDGHKPSVRRAKGDKVATVLRATEKMSPEQKAALLAELMKDAQ